MDRDKQLAAAWQAGYESGYARESHRNPYTTAGAVRMQTAYLIAVFQIKDNVPIFLGVDIFSEPEPTCGGDRRCFVIWKEDDVTLDAAIRHLRRVLDSAPQLTWAKGHLRERGIKT